MNSKIISNKRFFYGFVLLLVLCQLVLAFQGFDLCDEGFSLTFYQQFFLYPESVEYNFVYWLSGLIGGIWYKLYPEGGILWFRILAVLCNTSIFLMGYKLLKPHIGSFSSLVGLTMVLFMNNFGYLVFYHNPLTALLSLVGAYFILKGIETKKLWLLMLSGMAIGINVFSRIPNLTLFAFLLIIPLAGYLKKEPFVKSIKPMVLFLIGIALGFLVVVLILSALDQLEIMEKALGSLVSLGTVEASGHNSIHLLRIYLNQQINVLLILGVILLYGLMVLGISSLVKSALLKKMAIILSGFLFFLFLFEKQDVFAIFALGYLGAIGLLFTKRDQSIKLLTFASLIIMVCLPLGSGGAILSSGYIAVWLGLPLFFYFLLQVDNFSLSINSRDKLTMGIISKRDFYHLFLGLLVSYSIVKIYHISQEAYFDEGSRFEKNYTINSKFAKGIYTTKERAEIINQLLPNLEKYVKEDDYLLTFDNIPMVHFLTKTRPYMYNPWVWIYDDSSFKEKLSYAEHHIEGLPVVLLQKFNTIGTFSEPIPNYMDISSGHPFLYSEQRTSEMNDFLERNHYKEVWQNDYFSILKAE